MSASGWRRLRRAEWCLLALFVVALLGPELWQAITGDGIDTQTLAVGAQAPSWRHPCGTDFFGRDVWLRTLWGLRMSAGLGLCAACLAAGVGSLVGATSGFIGGWVDSLLMRLVDILYTLPFLFVVIVLVTFLGRSLAMLLLGLALVGWLNTARMVRAVVLSLREQDFVIALGMLGASRWRVIGLHLIPNAWGTVVLSFGLQIPAMVLDEAFLSFLGLGVQAPMPSLGALISEGTASVLTTPWQLCAPALALILLLGTLNACGDVWRVGRLKRNNDAK